MDILMPQLGETVEEGIVIEWLVKVGENVAKGDTLFEVETEKVTTEVPALKSGVLTEILVDEGETVDVGTVLAVLAVEGEDDAKPQQQAVAEENTAVTAPSAAPTPAQKKTGRVRGGERLSPAVRKLLEQHGLDAADIAGSGDGGRLTRKDVLNHVENNAGAGAASTGDVEAFNSIRKRTGDHMLKSVATSPHVLQAVEVDFYAVDQVRGEKGADWKKDKGFSLTYLPFIAKALCLAIAEFPKINATVEGNGLRSHSHINLGIAVDLNFEGLMVPVVKNAQDLSLKELAEEIYRLSIAARDGALGPDDMSGGTYTISNSGGFGTLITAPIISQPQVAILSSDGVRKKPVVVEGKGGDEIAIHPVGVLAQSFDHRAFDGAYSAAFLNRLRQIIESTNWSKELS